MKKLLLLNFSLLFSNVFSMKNIKEALSDPTTIMLTLAKKIALPDGAAMEISTSEFIKGIILKRTNSKEITCLSIPAICSKNIKPLGLAGTFNDWIIFAALSTNKNDNDVITAGKFNLKTMQAEGSSFNNPQGYCPCNIWEFYWTNDEELLVKAMVHDLHFTYEFCTEVPKGPGVSWTEIAKRWNP